MENKEKYSIGYAHGYNTTDISFEGNEIIITSNEFDKKFNTVQKVVNFDINDVEIIEIEISIPGPTGRRTQKGYQLNHPGGSVSCDTDFYSDIIDVKSIIQDKKNLN